MSARARKNNKRMEQKKRIAVHRWCVVAVDSDGFSETACARSHDHIVMRPATRGRRPMQRAHTLHCGKSQQFELEKAEVIARQNAQNEQSERAKKERWPSTLLLLLLLIINTLAMQFRYFYVKIIN